jgi:hypothetical protein
MRFILLILILFINCVRLSDLSKVESVNYLYSFVASNLKSLGITTSTSSDATFQIQGTLKDSNENPIANAILSLGVSQNLLSRESVTTSTTTDSNGNYTLNLRVGNFSVKVTNSSGTEIGSFSLKATSTIEKPEITSTAGSLSVIVNTVSTPSPVSAPSNLNYTSSTISLTSGISMTPLIPTVNGIVTSYSVSLSLPSGISLNTSTGVISGTPTSAKSSTSYTITASNSSGSSRFPISIVIYDLNLQTLTNFKYSSDNIILSLGNKMIDLSPIVIGTPSSYSVSPNLPKGLSLNSSNGTISGTPIEEIEEKIYEFYAYYNDLKITKFNITITITDIKNLIVSMPTGILNTGQSISIKNWDDGFYLRGVNRNFIKGGKIGLIWQRCISGQRNNSTCSGVAKKYTYSEGKDYCNKLKIDNLQWRLPTVNELNNLIEYQYSTPPVVDNNFFPNMPFDNNFYGDNPNGFHVSLRNGGIYFNGEFPSYIRCISGSTININLIDNRDGTISDTSNGLIWQKCSAGQGIILGDCISGNADIFFWESALEYCENLELGKKNNWRLPTINELRSILSINQNSVAFIDNTYFPNTRRGIYWTSTSNFFNRENTAWDVDFGNGYSGFFFTNANKNISKYFTRCISDK